MRAPLPSTRAHRQPFCRDCFSCVSRVYYLLPIVPEDGGKSDCARGCWERVGNGRKSGGVGGIGAQSRP